MRCQGTFTLKHLRENKINEAALARSLVPYWFRDFYGADAKPA